MKELLNSIVEPFVAAIIMGALAFGIVAVVSVDGAKRIRDWVLRMPANRKVILLVLSYVCFWYLMNAPTQ